MLTQISADDVRCCGSLPRRATARQRRAPVHHVNAIGNAHQLHIVLNSEWCCDIYLFGNQSSSSGLFRLRPAAGSSSIRISGWVTMQRRHLQPALVAVGCDYRPQPPYVPAGQYARTSPRFSASLARGGKRRFLYRAAGLFSAAGAAPPAGFHHRHFAKQANMLVRTTPMCGRSAGPANFPDTLAQRDRTACSVAYKTGQALNTVVLPAPLGQSATYLRLTPAIAIADRQQTAKGIIRPLTANNG